MLANNSDLPRKTANSLWTHRKIILEKIYSNEFWDPESDLWNQNILNLKVISPVIQNKNTTVNSLILKAKAEEFVKNMRMEIFSCNLQ